MNEANVDALVRLFWEVKTMGDDYTEADARSMAERLASRGVLVPASLTDAEAIRTADLGWPDRTALLHDSPLVAGAIRYALERIAKGLE